MSPPRPWSTSTRAAARETRNEPLAMTSCWRSQSCDGGLEQRLGQRQAGVVDDDVEAAEGEGGRGDASPARRPRRRRRPARRWRRRRRRSPPRPPAPGRRARSAMTTQAPSAASRVAMALPIPDAAPVTSAIFVASGLGFGIRGELGLLERPVLDPELLGLVDGGVGRERLRPAHDVDGVDVELAGDAGGLLVLAEGEHADARHEHDRRVGAAHRGAVRAGVALVVGGVRRAVVRVQLAQAGDHLLDGCRAGQVEHHRRHLGAQEVVGARRAQRGQRLELLAGHEVEHDVAVGEVADHPQVGRGQAADHRGERGRLGAAVGLGQRLVAGDHRAERVGLAVLGDVGLGGADDVERVGLALPRRVPPGRDAVAAEDAADRLRVGPLDLGDVEAELEAGTAPGHPHDAVAEDLLRQGLAVGRRRDGDAGVGVQVVDVGGVDEAVHGRVDRGSRTAGAEAGSGRRPRPSRPRAPRRGRRRRGRASGPAAAPRGRTP